MMSPQCSTCQIRPAIQPFKGRNARDGADKKWPLNKGTGLVHPLNPHEHWHIDVTYIIVHRRLYFFQRPLFLDEQKVKA